MEVSVLFSQIDYKLRLIQWYTLTSIKEERACGAEKHRYAMLREEIENEFPTLIKEYKEVGKDVK